MYVILLGIYLGVELLSPLSNVYVNSTRCCQTLFQGIALVYTPTSNVWEFWLLYILVNIRYCLSLSFYPFRWGGVAWLHCGLRLYFLMSNGREQLSLCLFAIWISSSVKVLFESFPRFSVGLSAFFDLLLKIVISSKWWCNFFKMMM